MEKIPSRHTLFLFIILSIISYKCTAQDSTKFVTFMGFVYDENNKPIPGAVLKNQSRNKSVATELNGRFLMVLAPGDQVSISYIGFKPIRFNIPTNITDNKYVKNIILTTDTVMLKGTTIRAYPTAEEMFNAEINVKEVGENAGFYRMDHAPTIKAPNPLLSPISAVSNAIQKKRMQSGKGKIDAYHQSLMIKDFYNESSKAVPDSILNLYNK